MEEISQQTFFKKIGLPENFLSKRSLHSEYVTARNCDDATFSSGSIGFFRKHHVPHDRIHALPVDGQQIVLGFKEYLYRFALHPQFRVQNSGNYTWTLNRRFVQCPLSKRQIIRFIVPLRPNFFRPDGTYKDTARELSYIFRSGIPIRIFRFTGLKTSQQFLFVPA